MAHDTYHMLINIALDGDIEDAERADLDKHLDCCAHCADLYERMQLVHIMLARPGEVPSPVDFTARVMARIETFELRRHWTPWFIGFLAGSSLLAAISVALPIILLTLGLDGIIAASPAAGRALLAVTGFAMSVIDNTLLFINLLNSWMTFILNEPFALGTVLAALVLASTWIGVLESSKLSTRASQPAAS